MKSKNTAAILEIPKNVLEIIFSELSLANFRQLPLVCHFFRDYDYSKQKARIAKELLYQYRKAEKPQSAAHLLYQAASLGHIEAILLIWREHLDHAIEYASTRNIKPFFDRHTQDIEQWAKIEQPFIYYAVIAYNKALKTGDVNSALCSVYIASQLYNKSEKYQRQARAYLCRSSQTPKQFIPQLLAQAENLKITKDRDTLQKKAIKEVNRLFANTR